MRSNGRRAPVWWVLAALLLSIFVPGTAEAEDRGHARTIAELGYPVATLNEENPTVEFWLDLPGNWELTEGGAFELAYSHPMNTSQGSAALEVTINGTRVDHFTLGAETVTLETRRVGFVPPRPHPDGLHVVVEFLPRGEEGGCRPPDERSVIIRELSRYDLRYRFRRADESLEALPYPLAYPRGQEPLETVFVLDDENEPETLRQAARLAAWIGAHAAKTPLVMRVQRLDDAELIENANVIVLANETPTAMPRCGPRQGTSICLAPDRADRIALWITGDAASRDAVIDALVEPDKDDDAPHPWTTGKPTLTDLGIGDLLIEGAGTQTKTLYVRRPRGMLLGPGSKLHAHVTHAPDLDASVTISINDVLILRGGPGSRDDLGFAHASFPNDQRLNVDEVGAPRDYLVVEIEVD